LGIIGKDKILGKDQNIQISEKNLGKSEKSDWKVMAVKIRRAV
jgi:hypothetical protein